MFSKNFNSDVQFFKTALADVRVARRLMQQFLPEDLQTALDMRTLKHLPDHFVEEDFAAALSDMVYSAKINSSTAYICLTCVDQSILGRLLPGLILCYTSYVQEQYHKRYPNQKPPFIYTLVASNGQHQFQNTMDIRDNLNVSGAFIEAFPPGPIQLIDINTLDCFTKSDYDVLP